MDMRKVFLIFALFLAIYAFKEISEFEKQVAGNFGYMLQNLPQEKVYLHTDKSTYTVGENVWFRAYQVHAAVNVPMVHSRFIYVDLVDKRDSLVRRVKVMERDSSFYGQLALPEGLQQGEYCLRAYTYNMQNLGGDFIYRKKIRVINPKDTRLWVDVAYEKRGRNSYVAKIRLTDNAGEPYVHLPVVYLAGERVNSYSEDLARTDRDGVFQVRIDTTVKTIALRSGDYAEVDFTRDIHVPKMIDDFDVQFFPEGGHLLTGNWQASAETYETGKLTYNMDFYALAHLSKFIQPGAHVIESNDLSASSDGALYNIAALNKNGTVTVILANRSGEPETVKMVIGDKVIEYAVPGNSAVTVTFDANTY